jgi:hypothetical protein
MSGASLSAVHRIGVVFLEWTLSVRLRIAEAPPQHKNPPRRTDSCPIKRAFLKAPFLWCFPHSLGKGLHTSTVFLLTLFTCGVFCVYDGFCGTQEMR